MDYDDNVGELLRSLIAHPQLAISKGFIWVCLTGYLKKKLWLIIIFPIFPKKKRLFEGYTRYAHFQTPLHFLVH